MMKSMFEKMLAGEVYSTYDDELMSLHEQAREVVELFNQTSFKDVDKQKALLKKLLGSIGEGVEVKPPFYCDNGFNITLKDHVFINYDCVFLDCNKITIGADVMIGPRVQLYTATHPLSAQLRKQKLEYAREINIGDGVWLGGGAIVCPGVSIGNNTVIGAGSVVTKDIPSGVLAVGNPCRVIRSIEEED